MEAHPIRLIRPGAIDSRLKLHLLLLFCHHPRLCASTWALSERMRESPWDVEEALEELAECGLLAHAAEHGRRSYRLPHEPEPRAALAHLARCYDDPQRRDEIYALTRAAEQERRFRAWLASEERAGALWSLTA